MTNADIILERLDRRLNAVVELTLYGRAALVLGFASPLPEFAMSKDVDAVFWLGQAEQLLETTNFWDAVDQTNRELADQGLFITHFFEETQVVLRPSWREHRIAVPGKWRYIDLYRLSDLDLLLSKLMRDDPIDFDDACFIFHNSDLSVVEVLKALEEAKIPEIEELREEFHKASRRFLDFIAHLRR